MSTLTILLFFLSPIVMSNLYSGTLVVQSFTIPSHNDEDAAVLVPRQALHPPQRPQDRQPVYHQSPNQSGKQQQQPLNHRSVQHQQPHQQQGLFPVSRVRTTAGTQAVTGRHPQPQSHVSHHHLYDPVVGTAHHPPSLHPFLQKHQMNQQEDHPVFPATVGSDEDGDDEEGDEALSQRTGSGYPVTAGQESRQSDMNGEEQDQQDSQRHADFTPDFYIPSSSPISSPPLAKDMDTDASHRMDQHEWLDMGAYSGKQGSFGWYADFPVGGISGGHGSHG